jgi:hypothetical protein
MCWSTSNCDVVQTVRESLEKYEALAEERAHEAGEEVSWIILDLSPVPEIDATAVHYWCAYAWFEAQNMLCSACGPDQSWVCSRCWQPLGPGTLMPELAPPSVCNCCGASGGYRGRLHRVCMVAVSHVGAHESDTSPWCAAGSTTCVSTEKGASPSSLRTPARRWCGSWRTRAWCST